MKFQVWYALPWFCRNSFLGKEPDADFLEGTHAHLKDVEAPGLEPLWVAMQGENWSPNGEARELIAAKGLNHTSMSVGDVAVDENGTIHMVASIGFKKLRGAK